MLAGAAVLPEPCLPTRQAVADEGVEFALDEAFKAAHDDVSDGDGSVGAALVLSASFLEKWQQVGVTPLLWEDMKDETEVGEELES